MPRINQDRNIPAHAGKTGIVAPNRVTKPEHPRARGENSSVYLAILRLSGTSPRTRGKREWGKTLLNHTGNIPAHAGKTTLAPQPATKWQEHPRARGENVPGGC